MDNMYMSDMPAVTRRRVWQAHLSGSSPTRLEPSKKEGGHRGWSGMDLESGRRTLSRSQGDCRPLPCSATSLDGRAPTVSPGGSATESLDEGPPETSAGQRENRKTGERATLHRHYQSPVGREDSYRGRLLRKKCGTDALPQVSSPTLVCRLRSDRSRLQDGGRLSPQTIGNVLDRPGSQRDSRSALLSSKWPL